jgi:hypothetical protein
LRCAIHADYLSADESGGRAGEKGDYGRYLLRTAISIECPLFNQFLLIDFVNDKESVGYRTAGCNAINCDVVRTQLNGQAAGVFVDGSLCHGVDCSFIAPMSSGDGPDRDDTSLLARHHLGCHFTATENARKQVTIEYCFHIRQWYLDAVVRVRPASFSDTGSTGPDIAAGIGDENSDSLVTSPQTGIVLVPKRLAGSEACCALDPVEEAAAASAAISRAT